MRSAKATWYGPGLYGNRTACGKRLRRGTLGVAHKSLPCGTSVTFYRSGRFVTVPVIDRGPFRRGVAWDLTAAAAR
jgi:rare lipoprotein A